MSSAGFNNACSQVTFSMTQGHGEVESYNVYDAGKPNNRVDLGNLREVSCWRAARCAFVRRDVSMQGKLLHECNKSTECLADCM